MSSGGSKRALVTGAAGFVGKTLVRHLTGHGWNVLETDAVSSGDSNEFVCDVSNAAQVEDLFRWAPPITHVFHLAAVAFVPEATRNPARAFDINLIGTINVAETMRKYAPEARLIYIGSADAYGPPQALPITEDHPLQPANPYAITKAAADQYCAYLAKASDLEVVRMRPFNHSGPGQSDAFVLSSFAHQIVLIEKGERPPVLHVGNLDAARDFSHVDDVVRAYERAAVHGASGEAYNVGAGKSIKIRHALDVLLGLSNVEVQVTPDPERVRPIDVMDIWGSHQKLTLATEWQPEITFERLAKDILNYWRRT